MPSPFEFTDADNARFAELHKWLRWFAIGVIAVSVLSMASAVIELAADADQGGTWGLGWVLRGGLGLIFGLLWMRPLRSLAGIIQTRDNDIPHLMASFQQFSRAIYWGVIITAIQVLITAGGGIGGWLLENN
ncbi:MAG: hypothetical protein AB7I38_02910 [Dehalococcoidia bacterium]